MPLALFAQTPEFEVASVKPVPPPADGHISTRMGTDEDMLNYSNVTLKGVIAQAFSVAKFRVTGPARLDEDRYVIHAKIPVGARAQIPVMLQTLLKERFGMQIHREAKETSILALVVAKGGSKMKAADSSSGCHGESNLGHNSMDCHTELANLAELLSRYTELPVVVSKRSPANRNPGSERR